MSAAFGRHTLIVSRHPVKNRLSNLLFLLLFCLAGTGCAVRPPAPVADVQVLPQDAGVYLSPLKDPVMDPVKQAGCFQQFKDRFFRPWHRTDLSIQKKKFFPD